MEKTNINSTEARRRIDELEDVYQLAYEYGRVERATVMPDGRQETDAEHALNLAMIGMAYVTKYRPDIDPYRALFYFVFHDIDEFLHGDTPTLGATKESYRTKDEEEAQARLVRNQRLAAFPEFIQMLDNMQDLSQPENAIGKGIDKLIPGYSHEADGGQTLRQFFGINNFEDLLKATQVVDEKMLSYASQDILTLRSEMHKKVGEVAFRRPYWVDEPLFDM